MYNLEGEVQLGVGSHQIMDIADLISRDQLLDLSHNTTKLFAVLGGMGDEFIHLPIEVIEGRDGLVPVLETHATVGDGQVEDEDIIVFGVVSVCAILSNKVEGSGDVHEGQSLAELLDVLV